MVLFFPAFQVLCSGIFQNSFDFFYLSSGITLYAVHIFFTICDFVSSLLAITTELTNSITLNLTNIWIPYLCWFSGTSISLNSSPTFFMFGIAVRFVCGVFCMFSWGSLSQGYFSRENIFCDCFVICNFLYDWPGRGSK